MGAWVFVVVFEQTFSTRERLYNEVSCSWPQMPWQIAHLYWRYIPNQISHQHGHCRFHTLTLLIKWICTQTPRADRGGGLRGSVCDCFSQLNLMCYCADKMTDWRKKTTEGSLRNKEEGRNDTARMRTSMIKKDLGKEKEGQIKGTKK